jgi:hypothetical protein
MSEKLVELARKYGISLGAVEALSNALQKSGGSQAQFNHPELGGMGQWQPGMVMIGDMFNQPLKAKVAALGNELVQLVHSIPASAASNQTNWWPQNLGTPAAIGGQNDLHYAYFPSSSRLLVQQNRQITAYDTTSLLITGFSQEQPGSNLLVLHTSQGILAVTDLAVVDII